MVYSLSSLKKECFNYLFTEIFFDKLKADSLKFGFREDPQQIPADFHRAVDRAILILALADVFRLEVVGEFRV